MAEEEEFLKEKKKEKEIPKRVLNQKTVAIAAGVALIIGLMGVSGYFYYQYKKVVANPSTASQDELKNIVQKIGKFMDIPSEEPTLATVSDKEKLKSQVFFSNAENGDKVLIFTKSQRAILYRPSTGKVIEVMSLSSSGQSGSLQSQANNQTVQAENQNVQAGEKPKEEAQSNQSNVQNVAGAQQSENLSNKVKIAVYNGTDIKGLAAKISEKIAGFIDVSEAETANAKDSYEKTLVIDLTGANAKAVQKIVGTVGGETGSFPNGEERPDADILVIVGTDVKQ